MKFFTFKYSDLLNIVLLLLVFFVLSFKNPYDVRSLVSNLEPYPDSIFYSYPAWNLIKGNGFGLSLNNIDIRNIVPPSYSLYLMPFFAIFRDVRSFYLANIILSVVSIIFFYLSAKKIFKNKIVAFILSGILVTSHYFYILPQFLMAENISLTVFLILIWLILKKGNVGNIFLFTILNVIFLLIKLSNVPVVASLILVYWGKVFFVEKRYKTAFLIISFVLYALGGMYILKSGILSGREGFSGMVNFSITYFKANIGYYLRAIGGENGRFIWMNEKFLSWDFLLLNMLGVFIMVFKKKYKELVVLLILSIPLLVFMSFFYYPDTRYIYLLYPVLIFPIGFVLKMFYKSKIFWPLVVFLFVVDLLFASIKKDFEPKIITLKKQVGLNFRHAEQPWNYLAVQNFNSYFKDENKDVYLATFLPVYYLEYFKNSNYKILPISDKQEFPEYINKMCSEGIEKCYENILSKGGQIYLSKYYLSNNLGGWGKELDEINTKYKLTKVNDGCFDTCNIYKLDNY